jgi:hypothetical protein
MRALGEDLPLEGPDTLQTALGDRVGGKNFEDAPNRNTHTADTRMAAHFVWLDRNPVKWLTQAHKLTIAR